ncbi:MAG: hypothetical protein AAB461_02280 [Patescibacteria group bacterium]
MNKKQVKSNIVMGFDMDGVIIDHSEQKIILAKNAGFNIKITQTPSELMSNLIPLTSYRELLNLLYNHPNIGMASPLMPGVKQSLAIIQKMNILIFLISRRKNGTIAMKLLAKHGLWPKYFNESNTHFVKEVADKETTAKKLGITHYIDDEQKVLNALISVKNKFLFDALGVFKNSGHVRVESWKDISKITCG